MAKFMMTYFGGNPPETPEAGKAHFAEFQAWLGQLGDAVISPANPLKDTKTVSPDGTSHSGSDTRMSGYTLLEASDIDAAVAMAASCPFLAIGGTLEVAECIQMG